MFVAEISGAENADDEKKEDISDNLDDYHNAGNYDDSDDDDNGVINRTTIKMATTK